MNLNGIFIDDAGHPGVEAPSKFLTESQKSWCAVVIPSTISIDVTKSMAIFTAGVKSDYGVDELHFTDIYSGRGKWRSVSVNDRMDIFDIMASIFQKFQLPVFYQSFSDEFKNDYSSFFLNIKKSKLEFWNFQKVEHFALFLLLMQLKKGIVEAREQSPDFCEAFQVYIDEGIAKVNANLKIPCKIENIFKPDLIVQSSSNNAGIQIADFAAFLIARSQWILMHKKHNIPFSRGEKPILDLNSKLNHWTLKFMKTDELALSKEGIEFILMRDRQDKGLPPTPHS
jgi:hypothetical protein